MYSLLYFFIHFYRSVSRLLLIKKWEANVAQYFQQPESWFYMLQNILRNFQLLLLGTGVFVCNQQSSLCPSCLVFLFAGFMWLPVWLICLPASRTYNENFAEIWCTDFSWWRFRVDMTWSVFSFTFEMHLCSSAKVQRAELHGLRQVFIPELCFFFWKSNPEGHKTETKQALPVLEVTHAFKKSH